MGLFLHLEKGGQEYLGSGTMHNIENQKASRALSRYPHHSRKSLATTAI